MSESCVVEESIAIDKHKVETSQLSANPEFLVTTWVKEKDQE
jgi:hypothetical protein